MCKLDLKSQDLIDVSIANTEQHIDNFILKAPAIVRRQTISIWVYCRAAKGEYHNGRKQTVSGSYFGQ